MVGAFFLTQKWILNSASRRAFLIVQLRISHYYCLKEKKEKKKVKTNAEEPCFASGMLQNSMFLPDHKNSFKHMYCLFV